MTFGDLSLLQYYYINLCSSMIEASDRAPVISTLANEPCSAGLAELGRLGTEKLSGILLQGRCTGPRQSVKEDLTSGLPGTGDEGVV